MERDEGARNGRLRASGSGGGSRLPLYSEPGGGNRFRSLKQTTLRGQMPVKNANRLTKSIRAP